MSFYLMGVLIYFFQICFFLTLTSWYFYWIMLEMNLILFLLLISYSGGVNNYYNGEISFSYFFLQVVGSVCFVSSYLLSVVVMDVYFYDYSFFLLLVLMALMVKVGLFPFHSWVYYLSSKFSKILIMLFLTFQKIPVFASIIWMDGSVVYLIFLLSLILGSLFVLFSMDLVNMIVSSSLMSFFYFYFCSLISLMMFAFLFVFYYFMLFMFFMYFDVHYLVDCSKNKCFNFMIIFMMMGGLPPFFMFLSKVGLLLMMVEMFSFSFSVILFLFSLISLVGYLSFFYYFFYSLKSFNKNFYFTKIYGLFYFLIPMFLFM